MIQQNNIVETCLAKEVHTDFAMLELVFRLAAKLLKLLRLVFFVCLEVLQKTQRVCWQAWHIIVVEVHDGTRVGPIIRLLAITNFVVDTNNEPQR